MIRKIGNTAGKVWKALRETEEMSASQLAKTLKEKDAIVYQALGWLAREDKIEYHTKGNRVLVSLKESERRK